MASGRSDKKLDPDIAVGLEVHRLERRLDALQIIAFASQFAPQPFHLDAEAARDTVFQGGAASGARRRYAAGSHGKAAASKKED